jgi:hypothetical protein
VDQHRINELTRALIYAAECVAAQTLDVKALGKGRKGHLVNIVNGMLATADGTGSFAPRFGRAVKDTNAVRARFPELTAD